MISNGTNCISQVKSVQQHIVAFRHLWKNRGKHDRHPQNGVWQMFSRLRAVEDLEPLPLSEAEVILGPGFIVVKSHKQSHPCRKTKRSMWWFSKREMNYIDEVLCLGFSLWFHCWVCSSVQHMGCLLCNGNEIYIYCQFLYPLHPICCFSPQNPTIYIYLLLHTRCSVDRIPN